MNEAAKLIYYIVFITVEREVLYVLYALCHNEIITSDAHSTDTQEYTEALRYYLYLGIESRPRLASTYQMHLYSIDAISHFKELDYKIFQDQRVD